jgi:DNA-binding transcriptional ArsR family regulator
LTGVFTFGIVRYVPNQPAARLNRVFHGLADPTRRAVLERLSTGPAAVSDLAEPFTMSLPSFLQHLDVLENCGLVKSRKTGRVRTYQLTPQPLKLAEGWLEKRRAIWTRRLDQLDTYLADLKEQKS